MNKMVLTEKMKNLTAAEREPRVKLLQRQQVQRDVSESSSFMVLLNERLLGTVGAGSTALSPPWEECTCGGAYGGGVCRCRFLWATWRMKSVRLEHRTTGHYGVELSALSWELLISGMLLPR